MKVTICDRCGAKEPDPMRQIGATFSRPIKGLSYPSWKYTIDLCPDCFEEIQRWLAGYAFEAPAKKETKP